MFLELFDQFIAKRDTRLVFFWYRQRRRFCASNVLGRNDFEVGYDPLFDHCAYFYKNGYMLFLFFNILTIRL